ncbi:MAG TPA: hypothetical protein VJ654_12865 [Noviherbaspirillum sp.]|nr:hypothetical protein [Noviherbaspirillum sp.]
MNKKLLLVFLLLCSGNVFAATVNDVTVLSTITQAMVPAANKLLSQAIKWLAAFVSIQFVITNFALIKKGASIEEVFAKLIGSFAWIGFCGYVLDNGPAFIADVGNQFFGVVGLALPSPGSIIAATVGLVASLAAIATGVGVFSTTAGTLIVYILLILLGIGLFFAAKIFMVQLELGLVVMVSPLSFSFLGLNALKDQGIAPFKALISLGYRVILMTVVLSAFTQVGNVVTNTLSSTSTDSITLTGVGTFVNALLSALGAYVLLSYALFKSDSIASALASGTTNLGPADVAQAAAMGAAAGAAAAAGGANVAGGIAKVPQTMGEIMQSLVGNAGSVSNASSSGAGPAPVGSAPPSASKSLASGDQSAANKPPVRPTPAAASSNAQPGATSSASNPAGTSSGGSGSNGGGQSMTPQESMDWQRAANQAPNNGQEIVDSLNSLPGQSTNSQAGKSNASSPDQARAPASGKTTADSGSASSPAEAAAPATGKSTADSGSGSGANAGIAGPSTPLEKQLGDLVQALSAPQRKGFRDHLRETGQHVEREKSGTQVHINTHNHE